MVYETGLLVGGISIATSSGVLVNMNDEKYNVNFVKETPFRYLEQEL